MGKKNRDKGPKPGAAEEVMSLIEKFDSTDPNDPNRGHFCSIVEAAVKGRVVTKEDLPLPGPKTSNALRGLATDASEPDRNATINTIRSAATAILDPNSKMG